MASINWQKATMQKITSYGFKAHFDLSTRTNKDVMHSNTHINTEKTIMNWCTSNWQKAVESLQSRTKEVDEKIPPKRIKKDRVVGVMLEFPCPAEIEKNGKSDDFFFKAEKLIKEQFGEENVHGMYVHKDEQHTYTDKDGSIRMSLQHAHILISPYTDEKGINGKAFVTRTNMIDLNKKMDEMVLREYGIGFNTHGEAQKKSVEELKRSEWINERKRIIKLLENKTIHQTEKMEELTKLFKESMNILDGLKENLYYAEMEEVLKEVGMYDKVDEIVQSRINQKFEDMQNIIDDIEEFDPTDD